jgi:glycosyltransferase involved in cell wall biosynthesis
MKIVQVYNAYQYASGEDTVVEEEKNLLESNGHRVIQFLKHNKEITAYSKIEQIRFALNLRGSKTIAIAFKQLLLKEKPDVCHVHNVFSIITPVIFSVCKELNVPVVQTLHNYRLLCTNTLFFRNGHVCELCMGKSLYNSIKYKCFRDSYLMTGLMADSIQFHRNKQTWQNQIDAYICLSEFAKAKFTQGGLPENKLHIKPNSTASQDIDIKYEDFFLYVGRLEAAKGLFDFISLVKQKRQIQFIAIGHCDDPALFKDLINLQYLGQRNKADVIEYMSRCKALIFPSKMYEGMPMVIIESFAMKKAVIARNLGVMASMIKHNENGMLFNSQEELLQHVDTLHNNLSLCKKMGNNAFQEFTKHYSSEAAYHKIISIYNKVIENNGANL